MNENLSRRVLEEYEFVLRSVRRAPGAEEFPFEDLGKEARYQEWKKKGTKKVVDEDTERRAEVTSVAAANVKKFSQRRKGR